jgi:hypothetical protein
MKSNPLPPAVRAPIDVLDRWANKDSTLPRRVGAWILRELRGALPPTIFFFVGFNFIILTTNLLVADYAVAVSNFMLATVAALVVGKAVITANAMAFLKIFDRAPTLQRHLPLDTRSIPDLCDGVGTEPTFGTRGNAATPVHLSAVGASIK